MRDILQRSKPPVNIFALCDLFALGVVEEAARTGLDIGKDVRVIGFDDHPWTAELGLTTVHQNIEEMGETAAGLLLERLSGDKSPVREVRFTPELVVRNSA
jgi:LacI family transcriptional regulator